MKNNKVEDIDLTGKIEDFPIEVVRRMVECQVEQGNKANVSIFQRDSCADDDTGGFEWTATKEGKGFWEDVIGYNDFDVFFKKYPKYTQPEKTRVWIRGNNKRGKEVIKALTDLGAKESSIWHTGGSYDNLYYIETDNVINATDQKSLLAYFLINNYKEIKLPSRPKDKELVWCWNDTSFERDLKFYDAKNDCTFSGRSGSRDGNVYEHYMPYEGEYPDWAKKAYKCIENYYPENIKVKK